MTTRSYFMEGIPPNLSPNRCDALSCGRRKGVAIRWIHLLVVAALIFAACGSEATPDETVPETSSTISSTTTTVPVPTTQPGPPAAPWSEPSTGDLPQVLIDQWNAAGNQDWCSALFPTGLATFRSESEARTANFSGGWGVAWDFRDGPGRLPSGEYCDDCGRGAFGVAGTGTPARGEQDVAGWPNQIVWDDDSVAGYGYEGDAGPDSGAPLLMYLLLQGEGCLYNVWSFLGEDHLLQLVDGLRRAEGLQGQPTLWQSQLPPPQIRKMGAPPWEEEPLAESDIPAEMIVEWTEEAGAPDLCPLLAFDDLGDAAGAKIRRATNEGNMLVAWDLDGGPGHDGGGYPCESCGRGTIGIGTFLGGGREGIAVTHEWDDGSLARAFSDPITYGTEVFLEVEGWSCSYWLWSHLGDEHLEFLMSHLRRVEGMP